MNKCLDSLRNLRARDVGAIAALSFIFLPFLWVQYFLFGPSDRVLSLLTSHFHWSADALTAASMTLWCLLFAIVLFVGDRFLRRFLFQKVGNAK